MSRRTRTTVIVVVVILALAIGGYLYYRANFKDYVDTARALDKVYNAEQSDISYTVSLNGRVWADGDEQELPLEPPVQIVEDAPSETGETSFETGNDPADLDGDPAEAGELVYRMAYAEEAPFRLLLGSDAVKAVVTTAQGRIEEAEKFAADSRSTDF